MFWKKQSRIFDANGATATVKSHLWFPGILKSKLCADLTSRITRIGEKAIHGVGDFSGEPEMQAALGIAAEYMLNNSFVPLHAMNQFKLGPSSVGTQINETLSKAVFPSVANGARFEMTNYSGCFITFAGTANPNFTWHNDGQFDGFSSAPGITVWIPLQDCGVDRPSLQVIDASDDEIRQHVLETAAELMPAVGDNPTPEHFDKHLRAGTDHPVYKRCFSQDALLAKFGPRRILRLQCRAGDCFVMSNWAVHATYYPPAPTSTDRIAAVLRYTIH